LADALLGALLANLPAERAALLLFRDGDDDPFLACTLDRAAGAGAVVDANRAAVGRALNECVSVLSGGSLLAAPLISRQKAMGVIYLDSKSGGLTTEHLQLAAAAGVICGPAVEDALEFRRVEEENHELREQIRVRHEMVGESARMQQVYSVIARAAPTDSTVLILGETGTGKELVARAIHRNSAREKGPFVAINCAALTETLLESELFGHERGAFTGAVAQKKGKLETADRGTLFLDEIGELTPALQAKLLRVLQEREFERVGGTRPIRVDIRILAATNRDLRSAAAERRFRSDLYYRLNVVTIKMPALRERREDLPLLANYFLERCAPGVRKVSGISGRARACLAAYDWPGNVRELQHAIESAVILGTSELIQPEDLPEAVWDATPAVDGDNANSYHVSVREQKSELILGAIEEAGGNITEAAKLLRLNPNYLHRLIRNLGLRERIRTGTPVRH
jgi:Nif-specific regulatory protein